MRDGTWSVLMKRLFPLLPGLLCAAESPEFVAEMHAWEAEIARPGTLAARDLPENVRGILALEPTERDETQAVTLANYFRTVRGRVHAGGEDRVATARAARDGAIRQRFLEAGISYPPREIFLRAFKHEMEVELWARENDEPFRAVATFPVTAASGEPGPKRREGDRQVPEGCYAISVFNPKRRFHLSLGLNYPNESDRILADRTRPGGEIYIHGGAASIGCLPLGDPAIEELFLIALDTRECGQRAIPVHIFPAKMSGEGWDAFSKRAADGKPELGEFWENLRPVHDAFERTRRVPEFLVRNDGRYELR